VSPAEFVAANTAIGTAPLVPEIRLHLATEITPIWQATETWLEREGVAPPFWAFAWPGAQALARRVLDDPALVRGRSVLDFAAGGGLAAIACVMAGATAETAELDPLATAATLANAALNGIELAAHTGDVVGSAGRWDLILCGDVCYEAPMTQHIMPWLRGLAGSAEVWIADPGRAYMPTDGMTKLAIYEVPTTLELEDRTARTTTIYQLLPG
jgi:predicted nicotinamide N-methyase